MKAIIASFCLLFFTAISVQAESAKEAPERANECLEVLLEAVEDNDLKSFRSVCDDNMQEVMTQKILDGVSGKVAKPMKQGYEVDYFGVLDRKTFKTYYYKITFTKGSMVDLMAEVSLDAAGDVSGFYLR